MGITFLGKIIRVDSNSVEIEISDAIPSAAPIINSRLYKIGQIGTFVKFPLGNITIYGIVSGVSNTPYLAQDNAIKELVGSRYLTVQLIGERIADGEFEKGIGTYPTINDEAHLVVEKDLFEIYGDKGRGSITIGSHSSSENLKVHIDAPQFVLKHGAILGSTGSGKSNGTAGIIKSILNDFPGSRIVLIDPHGEYASAFPDARVLKINDDAHPLFIPFWLMTYEELAYFLVGADTSEANTSDYRKFREVVTTYKRQNLELKAGKVSEELVTADSPIPFDIRKIWHEMHWWLNATFSVAPQENQTQETAELEDGGDSDALIPASFRPYGMGQAAPYKSKTHDFYTYEKKLLARLKDSRFDFMFDPGGYRFKDSQLDLHDLLGSWIGNAERLTILDLSGVPFEVLDISIGLITRFIYDSMFWGKTETFTGRGRPLLLVFEEAHTYLNKNRSRGYSLSSVERVFKEGRKFGVGALVVSQRPSEISETILAQIGTYIALRLTNSGDQSIVKASAPDNMNGLIDLLPSLRTGEAIVVGEAIKIPSRVRLPLNHPRPASDDPDLVRSWGIKSDLDLEGYKKIATRLREQRWESPQREEN